MKQTSNTKLGLVYKNHGAWSKIPSKVYTNLKNPQTMARIIATASAQRKQPAKLVRVS